MRLVLAALIGLGMAWPAYSQNTPNTQKVPAVLKFQAKSIDGKAVDLAQYRGKVLLVVNVASECGYTEQYAPLQALHAKFGGEGLAILGFPSNEFGGQEPGTEAQIKQFCIKNYGVKFDLFSKVKTTGDDAHPLFKHLTSKETNPRFAGPIRWNFEKFLIGRDGTVLARFPSDADPEAEDFQKAIREALAQK